jgi:hypothetical protein
LARNQNNVSEWGDMSIHGLLLQWDSTICWSSTKWTSSSFNWNLSCSCHDIAEKLLRSLPNWTYIISKPSCEILWLWFLRKVIYLLMIKPNQTCCWCVFILKILTVQNKYKIFWFLCGIFKAKVTNFCISNWFISNFKRYYAPRKTWPYL